MLPQQRGALPLCLVLCWVWRTSLSLPQQSFQHSVRTHADASYSWLPAASVRLQACSFKLDSHPSSAALSLQLCRNRHSAWLAMLGMQAQSQVPASPRHS